MLNILFIISILISTLVPNRSFANHSMASYSKSCLIILSKSNGETALVLAAKNACLQMPNAASARVELNAVKNEFLSDRAFVTRRLSQIIVVSSLLDAGVSAKDIGDSTESFFNRTGENGLILYIPYLFNDIGFENIDVNFDTLENLRSRMTGELNNRNAVYALSYFFAELMPL